MLIVVLRKPNRGLSCCLHGLEPNSGFSPHSDFIRPLIKKIAKCHNYFLTNDELEFFVQKYAMKPKKLYMQWIIDHMSHAQVTKINNISPVIHRDLMLIFHYIGPEKPK